MTVTQVGKFYPPYRGGMETHLEALCRELRLHSDVSVLVANDRAKTTESVLDGVQVTRLGTWFHISSAPVCPALPRRLQQDRSDIVHIHLPNPAAVVAYLASGHRGRLVLTYHSDVVRQRYLEKVFRPILLRAMRQCSAIICSSPNYIESSPVLRQFRHLCRVIPLGISVESFDRYDPWAVSRIRLEHGPSIVLAVGRLVSYKGFEHLIQAMSSVDAKLLIIGSGPLRSQFEKQISELGLGNRITLMGDVDDLVPYYHAADIFVLPSIARTEAFGIVQLEAMACYTPVINTNIDSGVPFVSPDGVTGLTVNPASASELADAINRLTSDRELRKRYGQAARARVETHFSVKAMTQQTLRLYSDVLAQGVPSRSSVMGTRPKPWRSAESSG
jgi:rhamnosyl/mannosyltransferase